MYQKGRLKLIVWQHGSPDDDSDVLLFLQASKAAGNVSDCVNIAQMVTHTLFI